MAKKLVITLTLEDEENWRDAMTVRRVLMAREMDGLRGGPRKYIEAEAGLMYDQLIAAEEVRHG